MNLELVRNEKGILEAQCDAPLWQHGEQLVRHLKRRFEAHIIDKAEGPDARTWILRIEGKEIVVYQWDTGDISFFAKNRQDEELTSRIAASVQTELK